MSERVSERAGELQAHARQIAAAALRAVDAEAAVRRWLSQYPVEVNLVAAAGKAAAGMARAAVAALGDKLEGGIVAVPEGYDDDIPAVFERHVTSHPLPDERSVVAGRAMWDRVVAAGPGARWLGLWSGGASAALELPAPGASLEALREAVRASMTAGEDIVALAARRTALSALKGGKLALASGARWQNLVLSDVPGDDPALVGGGPAVLPGDGTAVVATLDQALEAAKDEAFALRYATVVLDRALSGEARLAGEHLGRALAAAAVAGPPMALFLAGEPTVRGVPDGATGGRMQELALSAALAIEGLPAVVLALATDGRDGNSPPGTSGALVSGQTAGRLREAGLDGRALLDQHESGRALATVDAVLALPAGRTNVRDLVVALVRP